MQCPTSVCSKERVTTAQTHTHKTGNYNLRNFTPSGQSLAIKILLDEEI